MKQVVIHGHHAPAVALACAIMDRDGQAVARNATTEKVAAQAYGMLVKAERTRADAWLSRCATDDSIAPNVQTAARLVLRATKAGVR